MGYLFGSIIDNVSFSNTSISNCAISRDLLGVLVFIDIIIRFCNTITSYYLNKIIVFILLVVDLLKKIL